MGRVEGSSMYSIGERVVRFAEETLLMENVWMSKRSL
jgi:hypothetical protein